MLPILHIISPSSPIKNMSVHDVPAKPRRKKIEVPVHQSTDYYDGNKKTFSANFNSRRCKHRHEEDLPVHTEVVVEIPEADRSLRISKKHLTKENNRLDKENKELVTKFHELEELSVRKITKLREKIGGLEVVNAEIEKENAELKEHYRGLLLKCDDLKNQLEIGKFCKDCEEFKDNIEKYSEDNNLLRTSHRELSEDLNMLKTVVYRLNVQLERYQETLRKNQIQLPNISSSETNTKRDILDGSGQNMSKEILSEVHKNHRHTPIAWGNVNSHTLSPLLDAYEDTIKEKEEIIQNYESELCKFTGKLKEIISENEDLYNRLNEDEGCSSKLRLQVESLREELKSSREQNDVLIKKCALKQDKVDEILKIYETKVSQMKRDFDVLHTEYIKCRTENATLKEKSKTWTDAQDEFRNQMQNFIPISVHTSSVNECKKWYEELKLQYENEKDKLIKNIESQKRTIEELNNEMSGLRNTKQSLEHKIIQLEKHIKKFETKHLELEHTLNEVQLSRSALRKQLHKAMGFAKDMVAEQETLLKALNQRHLENKAVRKIGSEMATRMDSLKSQLKDVQRNAWQEFTTVEQTIQEQADMIESMREEHEKEIEKLQKIIKEHEETNLLLRNDNLPMSHFLLFKDKYK